MFWLFAGASTFISPDWQYYRVGSRDCRMRAVDAVSGVVIFGAHDCTAKSRKMQAVALSKEVTLPNGDRIVARIESDAPLAASNPKAGLAGLFPGPATLRLLLVQPSGEQRIVAELMGSAREIIGVASNGSAVVVVFTYEKTLEGVRSTSTDVLGIRL